MSLKKGQSAKLREEYFIETNTFSSANLKAYSYWLEDKLVEKLATELPTELVERLNIDDVSKSFYCYDKKIDKADKKCQKQCDSCSYIF